MPAATQRRFVFIVPLIAIVLAACAAPTPTPLPPAPTPLSGAQAATTTVPAATAAPINTPAPADTSVPAITAAPTAGARAAAGSVTYELVAANSEASYSIREQLARLSFPSDAVGKTQAVYYVMKFVPPGLAKKSGD